MNNGMNHPNWNRAEAEHLEHRAGLDEEDKEEEIEEQEVSEYECPDDCPGCSCFNSAPCSHCVDHFKGDE